MNKELFISSTPHETKVAISEDDQLTEVYFERENEYTLAGSIYKGRVTRVLPGMQSAFVDIGLERDAFLYVTDFFEAPESDDEEFETTPAHGESGRQGAPVVMSGDAGAPAETQEHDSFAEPGDGGGNAAEPVVASPEPAQREERNDDRGGRGRFGRRRRGRRGRGFPESKFDSRNASREQARTEAPPAPPASARPEQTERRPA